MPERLVAAVEKDRTDDRLDRVGQDRRPLRAAISGLALGQSQHLGQSQAQRGAVQAVFAHQVRAHAGEVALVAVREALEQQAGDRQAQHRIAQELKPLVVVGAPAAVGEGPRQQGRLCKAVAQALLQSVEAGVHRGYFVRPSYLMSRNTGP